VARDFANAGSVVLCFALNVKVGTLDIELDIRKGGKNQLKNSFVPVYKKKFSVGKHPPEGAEKTCFSPSFSMSQG